MKDLFGTNAVVTIRAMGIGLATAGSLGGAGCWVSI
jgi:hypothetical protein